MRQGISLLLLMALLLGLGGCGRAGTAAVEDTLLLFYPRSLVHGADGRWYALRDADCIGDPAQPVDAPGYARDASGLVWVEQLDSMVRDWPVCNDNPLLRMTAQADAIKAGETMTLPLLLENDTGSLVGHIGNLLLEIELAGNWYQVPMAMTWRDPGREPLWSEAAQEHYDLSFQVQTETASADPGLAFERVPFTPPAGHYRLATMLHASPGMDGYTELAEQYPELFSDEQQGGYRMILFVTAEFDIVA